MHTAPLSATAAVVALPDFSAGSRLSTAQINGKAALNGTVMAQTSDGTRFLTPGEIKGDGPIGDPPHTDGLGLRWNINTNVGFTTTSSASGAVSRPPSPTRWRPPPSTAAPSTRLSLTRSTATTPCAST